MAITTFEGLIAQINAMLANFSAAVGVDVVSANVTDTTDFSKATGTYVNTPDVPWTSGTIPLVETGIVKGGISSIWYSGPVLTKSSFTGGTVTMFSGTNVLNELCRVFIDVDTASGAYSVNIQTGFTGDLPSGPITPPGDAPGAPSLGLTETTFTPGGSNPPLAPSLGLTETTFGETWLSPTFTLNPTYQTQSGTTITQVLTNGTLGAKTSDTAVLVGDFLLRISMFATANEEAVIGLAESSGTSVVSDGVESIHRDSDKIDIRVDAALVTENGTAGQIALATGNYMQIRRVGTTLTFEKDTGGTVVVIHTVTGYTAANLYPIIYSFAAGNEIEKPEYQLL